MADVITAKRSRSILYQGDPNRNYTVIWSRGDPKDPASLGLVRSGDRGDLDAVTLISASGVRTPAPTKFLRERVEYESWHWKAFSIPANLPMGTYDVEVSGRVVSSITVAPRSYQYTKKLPLGEVVTPEFVLQANTQLRAYGTILTGNLRVNPGCTITGLTIDGNVTGDFQDVVFDSCVFRRGMVGPNLPTNTNTAFIDCEFQKYTIATIHSGLFLRCNITGRSAVGAHNFCNERGNNLACIGTTFDNTDRGFILRPMWGENSDCLYAGTLFQNICFTNNGDELLCVEGGPFEFSRNMFFNVRATNCTGAMLLFSSVANHNLFNNIRVPVDITGMALQTGNIIMDSECEYVRINWRGFDKANLTHLERVYSPGLVRRARNQATGDSYWWADPKWTGVFEDGAASPNTTARGLRAENFPSYCVASVGIRSI